MYLKKQETGTPLTPRQHHALEAWLAAHVNPSTDLTDGHSRSYIVSEYQEQFKKDPMVENKAPLPDISPIYPRSNSVTPFGTGFVSWMNRRMNQPKSV